MGNVKRVYVEKKAPFAVKALGLVVLAVAVVSAMV